MNRIIRLAAFFVLSAMTSLATALTYQPMLDDDLRLQAPVVMRGTVLYSDEYAGATASTVHYQVSVSRVYKGEVPASELTLEVPGSLYPGQRWIPGAPRFAEGDEVVLFLTATNDGRYRLVHLPMGAFVADRDASGQSVFARQLEASRALQMAAPQRGAISEVPRAAASFLEWLGEPSAEYAASTMSFGNKGRTEQDEFTTLGSPPSRWWQFDNNVSVPFRAHSSGQPGMSGSGFTEFQAGINAWNNDAGSNIRYSYAGVTNASGGLNTADGVNTILFNDPNGEVDGTFTCSAGGVLAIGGFVTSGNTGTFNGQTFGEITEGDIVTNNGAGCFFGMNSNSNGEEVFAHELGHTLGLGHSCEESGDLLGLPLDPRSCQNATAAQRDAIMKATPHADGRGADLRSDDSAGAAFLYPNQGGSSEPGGGSGETTPPASTPPASGGGGGGGGGCVMSATDQKVDMVLPALLLLSLMVLYGRSRTQRNSTQRVD